MPPNAPSIFLQRNKKSLAAFLSIKSSLFSKDNADMAQ